MDQWILSSSLSSLALHNTATDPASGIETLTSLYSIKNIVNQLPHHRASRALIAGCQRGPRLVAHQADCCHQHLHGPRALEMPPKRKVQGKKQRVKGLNPPRLKCAPVREEFEIFSVRNEKNEEVCSSRCRHCPQVIKGRNTSNLEGHLEAAHQEVSERVQGMFFHNHPIQIC